MLHSFTFCSDTYTECQNTMKLYLQHDVKSLSTSQWYMCLNQSRMWQNYKIKQEAWDFMCIWAEVTASYIYNDASLILQEVHRVNELNIWFNYV